MSKAKKGLTDNGDGEFILNESGTSVSVDHVEDDKKPEEDAKLNSNHQEDDDPQEA